MDTQSLEPEEVLNSEHIAFLKERGLPAHLAASLGLRSEQRVLAFDYRRNGETIWTKYRGPGKKFWLAPVGAKLSLWNLDSLSGNSGDTLVITEGEFDAMSCILAGYSKSVSVPNGSSSKGKAENGEINPFNDRGFAYLWDGNKLIPELARVKKIIIATDGDEAGNLLASDLIKRLGPERCFRVLYPAGTKDCNEVLVKHGVDRLRTILETAFAIVADKLVDIDGLPPATHGEALTTGWRELDHHLKLTFPELVVVTGKPGAGKSRWTLAWILNMARFHRVKSAYLSLEDSSDRIRRHTLQYANAWAGKDARVDKYGEVIGIPKDGAHAWVKEHMRFVGPTTTRGEVRDLAWLERIIWEAAIRHDCKIICLDPWNELEHLWNRREMTSDDYTMTALRELKEIGRSYGVTIVILCHPDKNSGLNKSIDEMTDLYVVSGSSAWNNKADCGIIVGREVSGTGGFTGNTIVKIVKRKDQGIMGSLGQVTFSFNEDNGQYKPVPFLAGANTNAANGARPQIAQPTPGGVADHA